MKKKLLFTIILWVLLQGLYAQKRTQNSPEYLGGAWNWPPRTQTYLTESETPDPLGTKQAWFTGFGRDSSEVIRTQPVMVSEVPSDFSRPNFLLQAAYCDTTWIFTDWSDNEIIYTHQLEPFSFVWVKDSKHGDMAYIYAPYKGNFLHHYIPIEYMQMYEGDQYSFQFYSPIHRTVVIIFVYPEGFEVNYHLDNVGLHVVHTYNLPPIYHKTWQPVKSFSED